MEIGTLVTALRSGVLNGPEDLRCANVVACYGSCLLAPPKAPPGPLKAGAPVPTLGYDGASAADHLESLCRPATAKPRAAGPGGLPWATILAAVMALVQAYLAAHGG